MSKLLLFSSIFLFSIEAIANEFRRAEIHTFLKPPVKINTVIKDPNAEIHTEIKFDEFVTNISPKEEPNTTISTPLLTATLRPSWLDGDAPLAQTKPISLRGSLKIGIRWPCSADIDIYSRSNRQYSYLFFGHKQTPEGVYYKDYLTSPNVSNAIEYLEYTTPVDVRNLEILLNFYSGYCSEGAKGIVRAWIDHQIYELPFHIRATNGNRARKGRGKSKDKHWLIINTHKLFKLM